MGEVIFRVPKKKKNLQIIKSKELVEKLIAKNREHIKKYVFDHLKEDELAVREFTMKLDRAELKELIATYESEKELEIYEPDIDGNIADVIEDEEPVTSAVKEEVAQAIKEIDDLLVEEELANEPDIEIGLPPDRDIPIQKVIYTEIYTVSENKYPIKTVHNVEVEEKKEVVEAELVEQYIKDAYDKGFADCKEIEAIEANNRMTESNRWIRRIEKLMQQIRVHYGEQIAEFKEKLLELSIIVAETVIQAEVQKDKNIVVRQIGKVLDELDEDVVFNISVNPDELKYLEDIKSTIITNSKELINTIFVPDKSISAGGCVVKTSAGMVDANIATQLKFIKEELEAISKEEKLNIDANVVEMNKIPDVKLPVDDINQPIG